MLAATVPVAKPQPPDPDDRVDSHIAFVLIDALRDRDNHNFREIPAIERYLSKLGIPFLTTATGYHGASFTGHQNCIGLTLGPDNHGGDVKGWCPLTPTFDEDPTRMATARAGGHETWYYVCNFPFPPYANLWLESNTMEARLLLGAMACKYQSSGFLHWGNAQWNGQFSLVPANSSPFLTWNPTSYDRPFRYNGEGVMFLADANGMVPTLRLEAMRDGIEDYEYYKLAQVVDASTVVPSSLVTSLSQYSSNPADMQNERDRLAGIALSKTELTLPFNKSSGSSAADASGKNRTSSLYNSPSWTTGAKGNAPLFNGSNQYAQTPSFTNSTTAVTVACWVKSAVSPNWNNAWGDLISKRNSSNTPVFILEATGNTKMITFTVAGSNVAYNLANIANWHHYAATYDKSVIRLYVDGVERATTPCTANVTRVSGPVVHWPR